MGKRSLRRAIARLAGRHRRLRDLRRRAEWADEARYAPTLRCWTNAWAGEPDEHLHSPPADEPAGDDPTTETDDGGGTDVDLLDN
jgi:hypothetical protein